MPTIYITPEDNAQLRMLLLLSPYTDARHRERDLLRRELDRAAILPAAAARPEAVGLGVAFEYEDLESRVVATGCLCLPADEAATPHAIPVLSRFGAAVIGCGAGNEVWWAEADRCRRIRIRRIGPPASAPDARAPEVAAEASPVAADRAELEPAV